MAQTNIKSTALEQPVSIARDGFIAWFSQMSTRYGLLGLCVLLVIIFSLTTESFASMLTLNAILEVNRK